MRTRLFAALVVVIAALGATGIQQADAHRHSTGTRMLLTFDHREPLKRGTVVRDVSGHRHGGMVRTRAGGTLRPVDGWFKRGAAFPKLCRAR